MACFTVFIIGYVTSGFGVMVGAKSFFRTPCSLVCITPTVSGDFYVNESMQNNRSRVMHAAGKGELLLTETVHSCLTWDSHVVSQWLFHLDKRKWSDMADMTQRHRLVCVI